MAELADRDFLVAGDTTEAEFQEGIGALYDLVAQLVTNSAPDTQTIASGDITPDSTFIIVDTEAAAAADNLDHILGTNLGVKVIFVKSTSSARNVVIRHNISGTGKFNLIGAADLTLDTASQMIAFAWNASTSAWDELWKNWGVYLPNSTEIAALRAALALGTAALVDTGTGDTNVPLNSHLGALAYLNTITSASLLGNDVVTNTKILDATISLVKLANASPGLVGFNSSGVASNITGTEGQRLEILGGQPVFVTPAGTGTLGPELIGSFNLNGITFKNVSWTRGAYRQLIIVATDMYQNGSLSVSEWCYLRMLRDGVALSSAGYYSGHTTTRDNQSYKDGNDNSQENAIFNMISNIHNSYFYLSQEMGNTSTKKVNGTWIIDNVDQLSCSLRGYTTADTGLGVDVYGNVSSTNTTTFNGISFGFTSSSRNFGANMNLAVYGVKP